MAQDSRLASFSALPQECVSTIISFTSPRDACRLSVISTGFRLAAESDFVWEKFLPSDCQEIISRSLSPVEFSSKKDLYFRLCDSPILLDGGSKSFALDKLSGKKCFMLAARELSIAWDPPYYWKWISLPHSRVFSLFLEVAHLNKLYWLDIYGKIETKLLSPNKTYAAYLVYFVAEKYHGLDHPPVKVSVAFLAAGWGGVGSEGDDDARIAYLQPRTSRHVPEQNGQLPRERGDGWIEIEIGEFFNSRDDHGEVKMRVREIEFLSSKSGLVIQGIEIRPKEGT